MRAILDILRRAPPRLQDILEPGGSTEAQWLHFFGQQCDACNSWRMVPDERGTMLACVPCNAVQPRRPTIYCPKCHYRVELTEDVRKSGACPHCEEAVRWPPGGKG